MHESVVNWFATHAQCAAWFTVLGAAASVLLLLGGRRAVYLTPEQHACLVCLLRELTPEGDCTVSSIVRNLVAAHLEEYRYPLQRWTRGRC